MHPELLRIIENSPASTEVNLSKLYNVAISPGVIRLIAEHSPQVESLMLHSCTREMFECLSLLPNLKKLSIDNAYDLSTEETWLESICTLSQLTHLAIKGYQSFTNTSLQKISQLQQLVSINFENCDHIFDEDLPIFGQFKHLRFLNLNGSDYVTGNGIPVIASLINLEGLELAWTVTITDKGFQLLSSLQQLKYLNLRETEITDETLKSLSSLKNLELLNIHNCPHVTNKGLHYLKEAPKLRLIYVGDASQITESAIQDIPSSIHILNTIDYETWVLWNSQIKEYIN